MRSIATFQRVCSNSIVLPRDMFFVEFDILFSFLFKKKRTNNLTSSGVHAVDSALVRINSAIHITSSFELLASILNLYILHHVSECHFLINIINNNKEFQKKRTYPKFAEILCLIITRELHRKTVSHIHYISPSFSFSFSSFSLFFFSFHLQHKHIAYSHNAHLRIVYGLRLGFSRWE